MDKRIDTVKVKNDFDNFHAVLDRAPDKDTLLTSFVQYIEDLIKKYGNKSNLETKALASLILFTSSEVKEKLKTMRE